MDNTLLEWVFLFVTTTAFVGGLILVILGLFNQ